MVWMMHRSTAGTGENVPLMFTALDWSPPGAFFSLYLFRLFRFIHGTNILNQPPPDQPTPSPPTAGCAWDGGCLLATLSSDGLLHVWAPPLASGGTRWAQIAGVTELLEAYLVDTGYQPKGVGPVLAQAAVGRDGLPEMPGGGAGGGGKGAGAARDRWGNRRARANVVRLDADGVEVRPQGRSGLAGQSVQDPKAWATRQDMAAVTAFAWAEEAAAAGGGRGKGGRGTTLLLAAGGPRLLHVWAFVPPGVGGARAGASAATDGEGPEEGPEQWADVVLNPAPKAAAFPEGGFSRPTAPADRCLAPHLEPVALWESQAGEIARLAWLKTPKTPMPVVGGGGGEAAPSCFLLAVASTYGNIDLVRVTGRGVQWAAEPLLSLSGADYGVVQSLRFGTIHLPSTHLPPRPSPPAGEAGGQAQEQAEAPPVAVPLLVAAKGNAIHAWTMPEGRPLSVPLEAHEEPVTGVDWARAPDGSEPLLLSAGMDGVVQVWRFEAVPEPGAAAGAGAASAAGGASAAGAAGAGAATAGDARGRSASLVGGLALVAEPALAALIPSRREALMGLAVSPNGLALAVARVAEGDEGNSRMLQFARKLRKNHACLGVQPLFQTGWRSVVLPEEPLGLLAAMGVRVCVRACVHACV
jgi:hypothetical protein